MTDVSVIVVNYNTREHLLRCLESVFRQARDAHRVQVFVVDNGSTDGSAGAVRQSFPSVNLICNEQNTGFAYAVNQGLRQTAQCQYHLILNTDAVLSDNYLKNLVEFMDSHPQAAIVTGQLLNEDGSLQHSFDNIPTLISETLGKSISRLVIPLTKKPRDGYFEVESVVGAAMMVRQKAIEDEGVLDEQYFLFLEETDWCYRISRQGWQICLVPDATAYHLQGQTKKLILMAAKIEYLNSMYKFFRKHHTLMAYWSYRLIKPIRILLGLIINLITCILTLGLVRRFRESVKIYSGLLFWHLRLCSEKMTLEYISKNRR